MRGSSEKYRFGFNGKENDNEVKGDGNSLNFGGRIYDSRLGRWLSLDPLLAKYPDLSPYNFCANNPIFFVDINGKDYVVSINHINKTITISAVIYTAESSKKSAERAAMCYNDQNGKYQYKVGKGKKAVYYDIIFDIKVNPNGTVYKEDEDARDAYINDKSGKANYLEVKEGAFQLSFSGIDAWGYNIPPNDDMSKGQSEMVVAGLYDKERGISKHEFGHSLGLPHWTEGMMEDGETRGFDEQYITKGNVFQVLKYAGIGKKTGTSWGDAGWGTSVANVKKETPIGTAPKDFENGTIETKK